MATVNVGRSVVQADLFCLEISGRNGHLTLLCIHKWTKWTRAVAVMPSR